MASAHAQGSRLRALRAAAGLSAADVARRTGVSRRTLRAVENGRTVMGEGDRTRLAGFFGIEPEQLTADRMASPVTVSGGSVHVGPAHQRLPHPAEQPSLDEVLDGYLHLVYRLRGLRPGEPLPLRDEDIDGLAEALGDDPATIEARLVALIDCSAEEARRLRKLIVRRRMVVPAAGLAFGLAGFNVGTVADALDGRSGGGDDDTPTVVADEPAPAPTTAPTTTPPTTAAPVVTAVEAETPATSAPTTAPSTIPEPQIAEPYSVERSEVEASEAEDGEEWAEIGEPLVIEREVVEPADDEAAIGEPLVIERDPDDDGRRARLGEGLG